MGSLDLFRPQSQKQPSAKQQEGPAAMATLDRQIPSPHTFLCKPWSSFVSAAADNPSLENSDRQTLSQNQAPKLGKQEMFVHGQFPTLEDFCLVVCNVCKQVVTPQGILAHYGSCHVVTL